MRLRLAKASGGTHWTQKKIPRLMVAFAMVAGTITAVFLGTAQPASAAVDDYKPAHWNMQGSQNEQDSKWQSGVRRLLNDGHNVIALQEAGQPPASAGYLDPDTDRIVPGEAAYTYAPRSFTFTRTRRDGTTYTQTQSYEVRRYDWRPNGSRGGLYSIYFVQTDTGGNRVNLAIVTAARAAGVVLAEPGLPGARPALGVRLGSGNSTTYFWSIHALSGSGNDAPRLLQNIAAASGSRRWAAMGDYNRLPMTGNRPLNQAIPAGMHIYHTDEPTHYGGNGNDRELDYMVTNQVIQGFIPGSRDLGSDHRAVFYFPMRAQADVAMSLSSDDNSTIGVGGDVANAVVAWDFDTYSSWHIQGVVGETGWYTIKDNGGLGCWDATESKLLVKPCNGSANQRFTFDIWEDTGQFKVVPLTKATCIGEDPNDKDLSAGTSLYTNLDCNDGRARLSFRWDHDPGADAAAPIINHDELLEIQDTFTVAADGSAQFRTVQAAIDAVPIDGNRYTIVIAKGTYNETITVPKGMSNLTIKGATGKAADVVVTFDRAHGYLKPDGTKYGTEGSAVASFKAPNLRVESLTIQNTFDPDDHPEVNEFETQAVALAATGDRQVYTNVRLISTQDTVLTKSPVATDRTRQYFRNAYVAGNIDFLFGNATAVFDRSTLHVWPHTGGTIVAPNTDQAVKYGLLITNSKVVSSMAANTFYLGRPWHNTTTASPQAVIRETELPAGITTAQPWTDMTPDYSWRNARFKEYNNYGSGAGKNSNRPQLTTAEAGDYTAADYLAGIDGWNPIW